MLVGAFIGALVALIGAIYRWAGRSPRRERIASWSAWRIAPICSGAWALAWLLDPDVGGIVPQGPHMWVLGPFIWVLMVGSPVLFVRWLTLRREVRA